jgi:hypothetical protein
MTTIADLFAAGRTITRMNGEDYAGYWQGYRDDSNRRRSQRRAANTYLRHHLLYWDEVIPPGEYGRITVAADGVHYCAGQHAPTEYYGYVLDVLRRMVQLREARCAS